MEHKNSQLSFILLIFLTLIVISGCSTVAKNNPSNISFANTSEKIDKAGTQKLPDIYQCTLSYASKHFSQNYNINISPTKINFCNFTNLGYGGSYVYNITFDDLSGYSVYYSGMGSGGHSYTYYCFISPDESLMANVTKQMCNKMNYAKVNSTFCVDESEFDATTEIRRACNEGLFSLSTSQGQAISFSQAETRCGTSVTVGSFSCARGIINVNQSREKLSLLVENVKNQAAR